MAEIGKIKDRALFAACAAPETVVAYLEQAKAAATRVNAEVRWLRDLLAKKTAHLPHTHACVSCSPDGGERGPGCGNCRQTGLDQMPCNAKGHHANCPAGCCTPGGGSNA